MDAIAVAGGLIPAGQHIAIEHADTSSKAEVLQVQNGAAAPGQNPSLSGGDKVIVERAGVVYVVGDVSKPGGYVWTIPAILVCCKLSLWPGAQPRPRR